MDKFGLLDYAKTCLNCLTTANLPASPGQQKLWNGKIPGSSRMSGPI